MPTAPDHVWKVTIRRNRDKAVRVYLFTNTESWDPDRSDWIWSDGNFACDCNRHLFFHRAVGKDLWRQAPRCGETRYTIVSITQDEDPAVLYSEVELPMPF